MRDGVFVGRGICFLDWNVEEHDGVRLCEPCALCNLVLSFGPDAANVFDYVRRERTFDRADASYEAKFSSRSA